MVGSVGHSLGVGETAAVPGGGNHHGHHGHDHSSACPEEQS